MKDTFNKESLKKYLNENLPKLSPLTDGFDVYEVCKNNMWLNIKTPFLDRRNDYICFYVREYPKGCFEARSDDYEPYLSSKEKEKIIRSFGIEIRGDLLVIEAKRNFASKVAMFAQALRFALGEQE